MRHHLARSYGRGLGLVALLLLAFLMVAALGVGAPVAAAESTPTSCSGVPGKFFIDPPFEGWGNQCQMVNDTDVNQDAGLDRETFVLDPGAGNFLTRDQLIANAGNFALWGFSKQFLWYAPMTQVHPDPNSYWSACHPAEFRPNLTFCDPSRMAVNPPSNPQHTVGFDVKDTTLDAIAYGSDWIALACGNFHLPVAGSIPTPVIHGFKFNDANRDGVPDNGESGLGGVTFTLSRVSSLVDQPPADNLGSATSDANGNFSFALNNDEGPGTYVVSEQYSSDWPNTTALSQTIVVPEGAGDGANLPTVTFGDRQEIPPVAVAAPQEADQGSPQGASVTLDGSASYSPTNDPLTYTWTGPFGTAAGPAPNVVMPPGTNQVTLTVSDGIKSNSTTTTVTVYPPITAQPVALTAVEGNAFSGTVATFTDPDPNGLASDYIASIDWGDGSSTATGAISKGADGTFTVTGSHTYVDEGSYTAVVTVTDDDVAYNTATVRAGATVADAALAAKGIDFLSINPVNQTLATFTDGNPLGAVADFTATIDWGDGTALTTGQIAGVSGGPFSVAGNHTYTTLGPKTITIHIVDDGGSTATAIDHVLLYQPSGFVIGDLNSAIGTHVTYWGAQWWKLNALSGGTAPAAFKGYANTPGPSTSLGTWTTDPGNSSGPPPAVPTYISVIVSSTVTQDGSVIAGDAPHIVIVQTDPGYAPDPGHAGTGTVVATLR